MLAVQPAGNGCGEEELAAVGVGSGIGHGQDSLLCVLQGEVLILELGAVDALSTGAVVVGEVTALAHEAWDDTMEGGALEAKALLSGAKSTEVLCGLGDYVSAELHDNSAKW